MADEVTNKILGRIKEDNGKYWASDNVSQFMDEGDDQALIEELVPKFESILDTLIIDRHTDPIRNKVLQGVLLKCILTNLCGADTTICLMLQHFQMISKKDIRACWL